MRLKYALLFLLLFCYDVQVNSGRLDEGGRKSRFRKYETKRDRLRLQTNPENLRFLKTVEHCNKLIEEIKIVLSEIADDRVYCLTEREEQEYSLRCNFLNQYRDKIIKRRSAIEGNPEGISFDWGAVVIDLGIMTREN